MARAITVRLDEADHAALNDRAERLGVRPGTLARMLVHAGLNEPAHGGRKSAAHGALDRLVQRSNRLALSDDAVTLVQDARTDLEP